MGKSALQLQFPFTNELKTRHINNKYPSILSNLHFIEAKFCTWEWLVITMMQTTQAHLFQSWLSSVYAL